MADDVITRANILFLRGVFLKNLATPEELFETRLTADEPVVETIKYVALPPKFTSIDTWPKSSNLRCWSCSLTHNNRPVFIPRTMTVDSAGNIEMDVHGHFCTFNCAAKYIDEHFLNDNVRDNKIRFLKILYNIFTGLTIRKINPAIDHTRMKQFVGDQGMGEREYRDKNAELFKLYANADYKMEHIQGE